VIKIPRRQFLHLGAGAAALPVVSWKAWAQAYPSRPVGLIVPSAAGGGSDTPAILKAAWRRASFDFLGFEQFRGDREGGEGFEADRP
jgi:hypothetical protein